jgi:protein-disulfide isomerase
MATRECPYSRQAFRAIERVERQLDGGVRFGLRHFPLTDIHPHAPCSGQSRRGGRAPRPLLGHARPALPSPEKALQDEDLQRHAMQLQRTWNASDHDRAGADVPRRVRRDVESGIASGKVRGTPTLFIDGVVHLGGYDAATMLRH